MQIFNLRAMDPRTRLKIGIVRDLFYLVIKCLELRNPIGHREPISTEYRQLRVMRRQDERGLSSAVIRGWQAATGNILGVIDADLQHPPHVLLQLLQAIEQQHT